MATEIIPLRTNNPDFARPAQVFLDWLDTQFQEDPRYVDEPHISRRRFESGVVTPLMVRVNSEPFDVRTPSGTGLVVVCNTGRGIELTVSGRKIRRRGDTTRENLTMVRVEEVGSVGEVKAMIIRRNTKASPKQTPLGRTQLTSTFYQEVAFLETRAQVEDVFQRMTDIATKYRTRPHRRSRS